MKKELTIIGRAEKETFPSLGNAKLHARIDTGAKTSSIWASEVKETDDSLMVRFGASPLPIAGDTYTFKKYARVKVASSMGHEQIRYKIRIPIIMAGRRILATFTLADRSTQVYPVLIGRATLLKKFIVDVSKGAALTALEKERSKKLQDGIEEGTL